MDEEKLANAVRKLKEIGEGLRVLGEYADEYKKLLDTEFDLVGKDKISYDNVIGGIECKFAKLVEYTIKVRFYEEWDTKVYLEPKYMQLDLGSGKYVNLDSVKLEDLIVLAAMEERCGVLSKLAEEVRKRSEELAKAVERLRKAVALMKMALS